jgi:putative phosphoribosyl transferase
LNILPHRELRGPCARLSKVTAVYTDAMDVNHAEQMTVIAAVAVEEQRELMRRERAYRDDLPAPDVAGKTVIIVDDGIATGSTMLAAVAALRKLKAGRIVVAAPAVAPTTYYEMESAADEVVAVIVPSYFRGVGEWYEDFSQTTDEEVRQILAQADARFRGVHA